MRLLAPWLRGPVAALSFAAIAAAPRAALAWVEAHVESDDTRISIERSGRAKVEHRITIKIGGGPLRSIDVRGVDADAVAEPDAIVMPQKDALVGSIASAVPVSVDVLPPEIASRRDPHAHPFEQGGELGPTVLRVKLGDRGLSRGVFVVRVRYATDFEKHVDRTGRLAQIAWRGAMWDDGIDSERVTFDLPAAPNAPQGLEHAERAGDEAPAEPLVLANVRRSATRDEIELVRPYTPRGEAVMWRFEADTLALAPASPPKPPPPKPTLASVVDRFGAPAQRSVGFIAAAALFLVFFGAILRKSAEVARGARAAGTAPRPLVPLPAWARAILGGAALVAGVALELLFGRPTSGALLVVAATALAAHRTPFFPDALRRRGRWYPLATSRAFEKPARPTGSWLDVSTRAGKVVFAASLAALALAVWAVWEVSPLRAELVALDVTALLGVFCTGRHSELPPDGAAAAPLLRKIASRLERSIGKQGARLVARIRVPEGADRPDELRLLVVPKGARQGFVALEIGVVFAPGAGGPIGLPEVLLRVAEGSPCEAVLARMAQAARAHRGRRAGERVLAFRPRFPTARMTAKLVARLATAVVDVERTRAPLPAKRAA